MKVCSCLEFRIARQPCAQRSRQSGRATKAHPTLDTPIRARATNFALHQVALAIDKYAQLQRHVSLVR
jgi:hypothetical protein